jgi:glutamate N-acetyltransferase/amino-acid N-acetyltransferase
MMKRSPLAPSAQAPVIAVDGVKLNTASTGIKYQNRDDLMLMCFDQPVAVAAVLTRSLTASAPVDWCRDVLSRGHTQAILCNAGNANAFTGAAGAAATEQCANAVAEAGGYAPEHVMLASTGVIGEVLPDHLITPYVPALMAGTASTESKWLEAADAIRTTDTFAKAVSRQTKIGDTHITITGIAKGSGMIAPDMATMLGFIATDADLPAPVLQDCLSRFTEQSFNAITVDGDTSTSDTVIMVATAKANHLPVQSADDAILADFADALKSLMIELAVMIVRDGEGATKLIQINVSGADHDAAAKRIGLAIGNSPLVKTAIAGEDANWGRIVMAVGKSGEKADRDKLEIAIGGIPITRDGMCRPDYDESMVTEHMKGDDIRIDVHLNIGSGNATIWTCDLTQQYIIINADYRS